MSNINGLAQYLSTDTTKLALCDLVGNVDFGLHKALQLLFLTDESAEKEKLLRDKAIEVLGQTSTVYLREWLESADEDGVRILLSLMKPDWIIKCLEAMDEKTMEGVLALGDLLPHEDRAKIHKNLSKNSYQFSTATPA